MSINILGKPEKPGSARLNLGQQQLHLPSERMNSQPELNQLSFLTNQKVLIFTVQTRVGMHPALGSCALWLEHRIGQIICVCCATFPPDSKGRRGSERRIVQLYRKEANIEKSPCVHGEHTKISMGEHHRRQKRSKTFLMLT